MFSGISHYITAALGKEGNGHCKEGAVVERFKQESMYGLSAIKRLHCCREVDMAIEERFKQESMYGLSAKKFDCCREVAMAIVERFKQESMY